MQMYVYAQKRNTLGELVSGWISNKFLPSSIDQLELELDMSKALRFDVDNNFNFMNEMIQSGWSLMVAGNKFETEQYPSTAPFSC